MSTTIASPALEHVEAFLIDKLQPKRLFGCGDYLLTQEELISLIGLVHKCGETNQSERTLRKFESMSAQAEEPTDG